MPDSLIVPSGKTVTINDDASDDMIKTFRKEVKIERLADLVTHGIVRSEVILNEMLQSSKAATDTALRDPRRFSPLVTVRGTRLPDLRRRGDFTMGSASASPVEQQAFWSIVRKLPPQKMEKFDISAAFVKNGLFKWTVLKYLLGDLTIESGGTLSITGKRKLVYANDVVIRRSGRILVSGNGLHLKAKSIFGEQ